MDDIKIIDYPENQSDFSSYSSPSYDYSNINFDDYYKFILENTKYNNAWSAEQAQKQMDFQSAQAALERAYGSAEAAKNRDWQKMMSDTAHQREIADLKAAGLNPVLSAMGGNGASVGSGATASRSSAPSGAKGDADQSANNAIVSMLNSFLSAQTQLETARLSAEANKAVAEKYTEMERIIQTMKQEYSTFEHQNYPNNWFGVAEAILQYLDKDSGSGSAKGFLNGLQKYSYDVQKKVQDAFDPDKIKDKSYVEHMLKYIFNPFYTIKSDYNYWHDFFGK